MSSVNMCILITAIRLNQKDVYIYTSFQYVVYVCFTWSHVDFVIISK